MNLKRGIPSIHAGWILTNELGLNSMKLIKSVCIAICLAAILSQPLMAQSEPSDDEWNHSLAVYLWGASIGGTTGTGTGLEVDFKDILDNLEFAFMGSYMGRKGKWSVLSDVIYMDVSADRQGEFNPPIGEGNIPINGTATLDMKSLIIHAAGGYNIHDDGEGTTTDVIFGLRYLDLKTDLLLNFNINPENPGVSIPIGASEDFWDAIVGLRGVISLGDRWFMPWGANVGGGDSKFTWQAMAGVGYKASSWADIVLTYRYLKWEFDNTAVDDLYISGPLLGAVFHF